MTTNQISDGIKKYLYQKNTSVREILGLWAADLPLFSGGGGGIVRKRTSFVLQLVDPQAGLIFVSAFCRFAAWIRR